MKGNYKIIRAWSGSGKRDETELIYYNLDDRK
jgi:hypothetical protein